MKISNKEVESILETYSLEEILEQNDLTVVDALEFLVEEEFVLLPHVRPIDVSDIQWDEDQEVELNEDY